MRSQRPPYEGLLVNGRLPSEPPVFEVEEGEHVRLRFINPSSATTYRVGVGGHSLTVTHADGRPDDPGLEGNDESEADGASSEDRWMLGGHIGGFLAVGCPICNVAPLALFSSSALMTYFDPWDWSRVQVGSSLLGAPEAARWDRDDH